MFLVFAVETIYILWMARPFENFGKLSKFIIITNMIFQIFILSDLIALYTYKGEALSETILQTILRIIATTLFCLQFLFVMEMQLVYLKLES